MSRLPEQVNGYVIGQRSRKVSLIPRHYRCIPELVRFIKARRPNVILARGLSLAIPAIISAKLAGGMTKVVMTLHVALSHDMQNRTHRSWIMMPYLARFAITTCSQAVAVSRGVASDYAYLARAKPGKIAVIYNPVVTSKLIDSADLPVDDCWFNVDREHKTLLAVGRLAPEKDFPTLFKALAFLRESADVRLLVIGDGPLREDLIALVESLNLATAVRFTGRKENPAPYMAEADAFVLTSQFEGLRNFLIEALAVGCPVVTTDAISGPREILGDGKWGPICTVGDHIGVARAIKSVLEEPLSKDELRKGGAYFSAERYAAEMVSLFNHLE